MPNPNGTHPLKHSKASLGFDVFTFVDPVGLVYVIFHEERLIFVGRIKIGKKVVEDPHDEP